MENTFGDDADELQPSMGSIKTAGNLFAPSSSSGKTVPNAAPHAYNPSSSSPFTHLLAITWKNK